MLVLSITSLDVSMFVLIFAEPTTSPQCQLLFVTLVFFLIISDRIFSSFPLFRLFYFPWALSLAAFQWLSSSLCFSVCCWCLLMIEVPQASYLFHSFRAWVNEPRSRISPLNFDLLQRIYLQTALGTSTTDKELSYCQKALSLLATKLSSVYIRTLTAEFILGT
jgi:hypothetical protein